MILSVGINVTKKISSRGFEWSPNVLCKPNMLVDVGIFFSQPQAYANNTTTTYIIAEQHLLMQLQDIELLPSSPILYNPFPYPAYFNM